MTLVTTWNDKGAVNRAQHGCNMGKSSWTKHYKTVISQLNPLTHKQLEHSTQQGAVFCLKCQERGEHGTAWLGQGDKVLWVQQGRSSLGTPLPPCHHPHTFLFQLYLISHMGFNPTMIWVVNPVICKKYIKKTLPISRLNLILFDDRSSNNVPA